LGPLIFRSDCLDSLLEFCKRHYQDNTKTFMSCVQKFTELQCVLPRTYQLISGNKLNIVLMCNMLLMVHILKFTEQIKNVKSFAF